MPRDQQNRDTNSTSQVINQQTVDEALINNLSTSVNNSLSNTNNTVNNLSTSINAINYNLTDDVGKAQMLFYNASGNLIQSVELTQRGQGQLNVFAENLTDGMYTYTLVVDGRIFATKKMVKQ